MIILFPFRCEIARVVQSRLSGVQYIISNVVFALYVAFALHLLSLMRQQ